jgi:nitrogen fixation/metabolism regulation signal transduction histidine kinase
MNTLKSKLFWGLTTLFGIILVLSVSSSVLLYRMTHHVQTISIANTQTIDACIKMLQISDRLNQLYSRRYYVSTATDSLSKRAYWLEHEALLRSFHQVLNKTEQGLKGDEEKQHLAEIRSRLALYLKMMAEIAASQKTQSPEASYSQANRYFNQLQDAISELYNLTMLTTVKRGEFMTTFTRKAIIGYIAICVISMLIITWFVVYFPQMVSQPIDQLMEKLKRISERDFNQKLHLTSSDEFRMLTDIFNNMAKRLSEFENSNMEQLLNDKKRMEAVLNSLNDPVIVLDQRKNILSVNQAAEKLLTLPPDQLIGRYAPDIAAQSDLVRMLIRNIMSEKDADNTPPVEPFKQEVNDKTIYFLPETIKVYKQSATQQKPTVPGQLIGYILTLKNITVMDNRYQESRYLIAQISHKLKTPISSINISLRMLEDERVGTLNSEQKNLLNSIRKQNQRLLSVVNEIAEITGENPKESHKAH